VTEFLQWFCFWPYERLARVSVGSIDELGRRAGRQAVEPWLCAAALGRRARVCFTASKGVCRAHVERGIGEGSGAGVGGWWLVVGEWWLAERWSLVVRRGFDDGGDGFGQVEQ
jgi:hypothetical protein